MRRITAIARAKQNSGGLKRVVCFDELVIKLVRQELLTLQVPRDGFDLYELVNPDVVRCGAELLESSRVRHDSRLKRTDGLIVRIYRSIKAGANFCHMASKS